MGETKPRKRLTNEQIAKALKAMNGYVSLAARSLDCAPKVIYARLKKSPALQQFLDDIREEELDLTEQKLREAIFRGEAWAISLKLKTQGRKRGYVERQEISAVDTEPITFIIERAGKNDSEKT